MRIALVYGGRSGEHEVSRVSASAIARVLGESGYAVVPVYADYDGKWYRIPDERHAAALASGAPLPTCEDGDARVLVSPGEGLFATVSGALVPLAIDLAFPVIHGTNGEDGTLQGLLEQAELPYVGAGVMGSAIGMDKETSKRLWREAGIPVVPSVLVSNTSFLGEGRAGCLDRIEKTIPYPLFVKPVRGGSSVGTSRAANRAEAERALELALIHDAEALVEPFLPVREIECSVIGLDAPRSFRPGEIVPMHEYYDYDAKYTDPEGARLVIPADLPAELLSRIQGLAERAYAELRLDGMARVDFFVDKRNGELYVNEVNTIPGFTPISMFPKMCAEDGLPFRGLVDALVAFALERFARRNALSYRLNDCIFDGDR